MGAEVGRRADSHKTGGKFIVRLRKVNTTRATKKIESVWMMGGNPS